MLPRLNASTKRIGREVRWRTSSRRRKWFLLRQDRQFSFLGECRSHDGQRAFLQHQQFYAYANVPRKGQRPADTEYPSSVFQDCWETDPQRKTHDAETQHPSCLPRRIFSYPTANSILVLVRTRKFKKSVRTKGLVCPKTQ